MLNFFTLLVLTSHLIFSNINEMTILLHTINKYDVGVVISSKKLQKYKDDIQKLMENMRRSKGATKGEPYLFTCEIIQTDISINTMKVSISLTIGRYRILNDERSFFQFLYSRDRTISLDLDNGHKMQSQLIHHVKEMLRHFKMML